MSNESKDSYLFSSWLFIRLLSITFFIAFMSLWVQVTGLVGNNGIIPFGEYLTSAKEQFPNDFLLKFPTLLWLNMSDFSLHLVCGFGILFSVLLFLGIFSIVSVILLIVLYLSLATVCQVFLGFQWDNLLIETGFLAIFLLPLVLNVGINQCFQPSKYALLLFKLLLFKLMFFSGLVKILSGDYVWANLTALTYHYETQPIPNLIAYYVHHLPLMFHKISCVLMFVIELAIPFFLFGPTLLRRSACLLFIGFQCLILLTGNYCFFNILAIALCILLLDDSFWQLIFPSFKTKYRSLMQIKSFWNQKVLAVLVTLVIALNSFLLFRIIGLSDPIIKPLGNLYYSLYQFRLINSYGLFAVMTTTRPEVVIEGSDDGIHWSEYGFKYKVGDLKQSPPFVAPHQPRLDWQMWFAALGTYRNSPWLVNFCIKLLEGSEDVLKLIRKNPFFDKPPRYIRALLYNYKFNSNRDDGNWWERELIGVYLPTLSLREIN